MGEAKLAFLEEFLATLQSVSATGPGPVEDLLYDWQQTARVLADPELTARLTANIETRLRSVDLQPHGQ